MDLSPEALEYGRAARQAISASGGDVLAVSARQPRGLAAGPPESGEPGKCEPACMAALKELGAWDLDPRGDASDLEAAAALCRAAGYCGLDFPLAERLAQLAAAQPPDSADPLGLVLPCWTLLGMLDRAIDLTVAHVKARQQFGQPLAQFQGVQFQLTDAEVERGGLQVLALYALWSVQAGNPEAIEDALALRMAALEAAEVVFRVAHQLHGAMGFCDETPLSWLSRYSQPLRRRPFGLSQTRAILTERIGRRGLTGLFSDDKLITARSGTPDE